MYLLWYIIFCYVDFLFYLCIVFFKKNFSYFYLYPNYFFRPKHGGKFCLGKRVTFRSCNTQVSVILQRNTFTDKYKWL